MKKIETLTQLLIIFSFICLGCSTRLMAQEIEVTNDQYVLKTKNSLSSIYGKSNGEIWLAGRPSTLFTIIVDNSNSRGIQVLNNWSYPAAFEVFGNGTVKTNNVVLTSDVNEKEQIKDLGSQIENIKKLKSVSYKWKDKKTKNDKTNYGLLAQDLEKIYPDLVFRGDSGEIGIYYIELIPVLLEAVKEQQTQIEQQAALISELDNRVAKLENKNKPEKKNQ